MGRDNNFDFLRLIAAIIVVFHHNMIYSILPTVFGIVPVSNIDFGFLGVMTFYVISGYLIAGSWDNRENALKFLSARILRVVPGLIMVSLFTILIIGPLLTSLSLNEYFSKNPWPYLSIACIIYIPGPTLPGVILPSYIGNSGINIPLWIIPFLFKSYLLLFALGVLGALKDKRILLFVFVLGAYVAFYTKGVFSATLVTYTSVVFNFFSWLGIRSLLVSLFVFENDYPLFFLMGTLMYYYRDSIKYDRNSALVLFVLWILSSYTYFWLPVSIFLLPYVVLTLAHIRIPFVHNVGSLFGDLSYGIYIFAFPIQMVVFKYFGVNRLNYDFLAFLLNMILVLPVAYISWHYVESRALKLKDLDFSGFARFFVLV